MRYPYKGRMELLSASYLANDALSLRWGERQPLSSEIFAKCSPRPPPVDVCNGRPLDATRLARVRFYVISDMTTLSARISILGRSFGPAAGRVLTAALRDAAPDEVGDLARSALERDDPELRAALVESFDRLPAAVRTQITFTGEQLSELAVISRRWRRAASRRNLLALCRQCDREQVAGVLPLLAGWLSADDRELAASVGSLLLEQTRLFLGPTGRARPSVVHAESIDEALAEAYRTGGEHRQTAALLAVALALHRPGPRLRAMLMKSDDAAAFALRRVAGRTVWPDVGRNLLPWLGSTMLDRAAARHLHTLASPEQFTALLQEGALLHAPRRRRALKQVQHPRRALPDPAVAVELEPHAQRFLPDYVAALGVRTSARLEWLRDGLALPDPVARLKCVLQLRRFRGEEARTALLQYERDSHAEVAGAAARWREPGERQRQRERYITDPRTFLDVLPDLTRLERAWCARQLLREQREAMLRLITARLRQGPRGHRLALLQLVEHLELASELGSAVIPLVHGRDVFIAAAATLALGEVEDAKAGEALRSALRHHDARVRANAVEAVMRRGEPAMLPLVMPLLGDRGNRVRANAIRATGSVAPRHSRRTLHAMLRDADPLHRISAIWVARRVEIDAETAQHLATLAAHDPQPLVRTRAAGVRRFLTRSRGAESPRELSCP